MTTRGQLRAYATGALLVVSTALAWGCGPATPEPRSYGKSGPNVCKLDQEREYQCEALLPRSSSRPAPDPFGECPSVLPDPVSKRDGPVVAEFDVPYTEHTRARMPPGHACCYSWCSDLTVVDPRTVDPQARCSSARTMRETHCIDEPESGASMPVAAPYNRCPAAIRPPEGSAYQVPDGALFDWEQTQTKRTAGFGACCYSWCSEGPPQVFQE